MRSLDPDARNAPKSTRWEPLKRPLEAMRLLCGPVHEGDAGKDGVGSP